MNFRSHIDLSLMLLEDMELCRIAFLFGSVEPDIFFPTYFRHSPRGRFHGHDYANMRMRTAAIVRKLGRMGSRGILYSYRLGKLVHYISDSFTLAHNEMFHGSIREHRMYERVLETVLCRAMALQKHLVVPHGDITDFIKSLHDEYIKEAGSPETDACFIITAVYAAAAAFAGNELVCGSVPLVDTP